MRSEERFRRLLDGDAVSERRPQFEAFGHREGDGFIARLRAERQPLALLTTVGTPLGN
jgi:hypothetical protein